MQQVGLFGDFPEEGAAFLTADRETRVRGVKTTRGCEVRYF